MSPMMGVDDDEDDPQHTTSEEAVTFTAETHATHIKDVFLRLIYIIGLFHKALTMPLSIKRQQEF